MEAAALNSYGVIAGGKESNELELACEEISNQGFTVLKNVLNEDQLALTRTKLDAILKTQENEFGLDKLIQIREKNMVRAPLAYDDHFISIATQPRVLEVARRALGGGYVILHLQNGIINTPNEPHHQSAWHRDLPYQEFVSSRPLALGALFCVDEFSQETGATYVLPFSHRVEKMPSVDYVKRYETTVVAPAGSVIVFDAMLFHRAGYNSSSRYRRAINNVYSIPILKQQIALPKLLGERFAHDPELSTLFDYRSAVPESVIDFREQRLKKSAQKK